MVYRPLEPRSTAETRDIEGSRARPADACFHDKRGSDSPVGSLGQIAAELLCL